MTLFLVVNYLWDFVDTTIQPPMNATNLSNHKKNDVKARLLILYVVRIT
jgi:hypothetical protein